MVVLIVNQKGVLALESKGETPIAVHRNRPVSLEITLQAMKPPSRRVHVFGRGHVIEHDKLEPQLHRVLSLNARRRTGAKELLYALVREALDHRSSASLGDTDCKGRPHEDDKIPTACSLLTIG